MINLQLPNIKGINEREQLKEMQSYLYQLVEQLQFALNTVEGYQSESTPAKSQMPVRIIQTGGGVATMSLNRGLSEDQATFQAIKPLIIKSADIVNAYYEEINRRLESVYVAQSDFGTFMEETSQEISETSTDITRVFSNIQTIDSKVKTIDSTVKDVETNIQTIDSNVKSLATNIETIDTIFQENIQTVDKKIEETKTDIGSELNTVKGTVTVLDSNLKTVEDNVGVLDTNLKSVETDLQDTKVGIGSTIGQISDEVGVIDRDLQGVKVGVESDINDLSNEVGKVDSKLEDTKSALGSDLKKLKDSLDELNSSIVDVKARIKSGLLYYDGEIPIYGLEIGQENTINGVKVFNQFARFCAGKLSFYDNNGTEVAYISDYKLYITHAEVTGTLKLGGYLVDTSNGVTFKWVGRS